MFAKSERENCKLYQKEKGGLTLVRSLSFLIERVTRNVSLFISPHEWKKKNPCPETEGKELRPEPSL